MIAVQTPVPTSASAQPSSAKEDVRAFWDEASCGEALYLAGQTAADYDRQAKARYHLEPYIKEFARFGDAQGRRVLEIGVGLGADHEQFARSGALLSGVDLTDRAIANTRQRLAVFELQSNLQVGDAEALPFSDATFDMVYSWGVIHHSPDTPTAADEILRVLAPGGRFAVMIYHRYSMVGYMLWFRYALLKLRPFQSLDDIYSQYLESPGTKAYSLAEAKALFARAERVEARTVLTHGDLLEGQAGQRHTGWMLNVARRLWPRRLIKTLFPTHGLFLLVEGYKPVVGK
ncbi:MAG: class I SAM-dependent methyltransferase [Pseudomonadota bacterium]